MWAGLGEVMSHRCPRPWQLSRVMGHVAAVTSMHGALELECAKGRDVRSPQRTSAVASAGRALQDWYIWQAWSCLRGHRAAGAPPHGFMGSADWDRSGMPRQLWEQCELPLIGSSS